MHKLLIATANEGKVKEFKRRFESENLTVISLLDLDDAPDVAETGSTFAENAVLKAEAIMRLTNQPVIADDSGLVVDALDGDPGVYSARYAGLEKDDEANIDKVLNEMKDIPEGERTASFQCVLAVAIPGEQTEVFSGTCNGTITFERSGHFGFGYDPIFYVPSYRKTMAELSPDEKNAVSHRGQALDRLEESFQELF
ncbi:XTP/dITP diphosphatase [Guptibacillus hwajinpoensis]|uniref:dITP/XTP pyrophosphatase n=1 Tax=Guptibacillus hwajinpoensis TaxID=208199 RepID=A0A0J6CMP0_9BACL|nr:XTP/dITP diphosphatase [Alkalihalobacillus macyae]KMM37486.1 nucleoside-triphosphate diphosphatase [Alkalihalobacillus macyae]